MRNIMKNDIIVFFVGLAMLVTGGFLFLENVEVTAGNLFAMFIMGKKMEGIVFIPLIASIIFLFYKYNLASKICCGLSVLIIIVNVIVNLRFRWLTQSLFATIIMFVLLFGGLTLVIKTLFANPEGKHGKNCD